MSHERRAHGARPRMSASLRHAMDTLREDRETAFPGDRLASCGVAEGDADVLVEQLYDYFDGRGKEGHPLRLAMMAVSSAAANGADQDAEPLIDSLAALPEGQRATFLAMVDVACAHAACEGFAVGALYVARETNGRAARWRGRPKR